VRTEGPAALYERLANPTNFTTELIDRLVDGRLEGHSDAFPRVDLARDLARITGALPPYESRSRLISCAQPPLVRGYFVLPDWLTLRKQPLAVVHAGRANWLR